MSVIALDDFFTELAGVSSRAILPFFRMAMSVGHKEGKGAFDPVTEGDKAGEVAIRRLIKDRFPSHGIKGEEFGEENITAEYTWLIDPIDGTRAFICGLPTWGTLVGLLRNGKPVYGMMNQPFVGEFFVGDGKTAHLMSAQGKRRLSTSRRALLGEAYIATTNPKLITGSEGDRYNRLENQCKLARYGTDCYAYSLLAAGHIDIVVETGLQDYDIAPLIPIIEGAGGVVTTWGGTSAAKGGAVVAAANGALHAQALKILGG
jgi:histidinol phosphatase-like enzyme (inositol monophosphatase family)